MTSYREYLAEAWLLEASVDDLRKQWVESGKMKPEQFELCVQTANNKSSWVTWLGKRILDRQLSLKEEDIEKWQKVIKIFERYKQRFPVKDINQIKTSDQISEFVNKALDIESEMTAKDKATQASKDKYAEFYKGTVELDGKTFKVYVLPKGHRENYNISRALAGDTHWCTAASSRGQFDDYIRRDNLIMFFNVADPKEKYQLHVQSSQFMDRADKQIPWGDKFTEEACRWAVEKGIASDIPKKLKIELQFRDGLPSEESAPKLSSFKVFEKDDVSVYYVEDFNVEQHYWAFKSLIDVKEYQGNLIGNRVLAFTRASKGVVYYRDGEEWEYATYASSWSKSLGRSEAVYEAFVFANKRYGFEIPVDLVVLYNKNLPDASTFVTVPAVGGDPNFSIYDIENPGKDSLKVPIMFGKYYENWGKDKRVIYCGASPKRKGKIESPIDVSYRPSEGWTISCSDEVTYSPKVQEAFAEYLTTKVFRKTSKIDYIYGSAHTHLNYFLQKLADYFCKGDEQPGQEGFTNVRILNGKETIKSFVTLAIANWAPVSDNRVVVATIPGTKRTVVIGNDTLLVSSWRANTPAIAKSLGEAKTGAVRKLAANYGITCKILEAGIKKYFPNLIDNEEEREQSRKISTALSPLGLLRTSKNLKSVDIPLYRTRSNRIIRLRESDVLEMSFKDFYPSLYKTSESYARQAKEKVSDSAKVYLYQNGDTWNCVIIDKDEEGRTTKIIRRRGYGMGVVWDFSLANWDEDEIDDRQVPGNLHESFDSEQRKRLGYLAGLYQPSPSRFGVSQEDYLDWIKMN